MAAPPVSDEERQLAAQAQAEFDRANYDACLATLSRLSGTRGPDPKIQHNKAVAELYKSKFVKTDEFRKALKEVASKVSLKLEQVDVLDDADQCIVFYNHAVILYHLRQYRKALVILDKLFQFVEPMEEGLSRKVMFFLVELYIQTHQPEKALALITYVEKTLLPTSGGRSGQQAAAAATPGGEGSTVDAEDALRSTISQYKARCFMMWKSLKSCKREVKGLMIANNGMTAPLIYLKANIEYLRGNYRKAIKVLNTAPSQTSPPRLTGENLTMMYHNNLAVIHFHMRKHHLGAMYLRRAIEENSRDTRELAKLDLNKSVSGAPLPALGMSRHYELLYNMGLQMLHCGQPEPAFDCLIETIQLYQVNPRLWLRLAECCIMAYKANNDEDRSLAKKLSVVQGSVGCGIHRKLILGPGIDSANTNTPESPALPSTTLEFASLCLKNALLLLPETTPETMATAPAATAANDDGDTRPPSDHLVPAPPGPPLRPPEVASLRVSVLAASAFVALSLRDFSLAAQHADALLRLPRIPPAHRFLGQLYLSEALVALDRIAAAVELLNPDNVTDVSTTVPETAQRHGNADGGDKAEKNGDKDQDLVDNKGCSPLFAWSPREVPRARAIMQYNLAVAHAARGEHAKALHHLNVSSSNMGQPLPAQMYCLKVYLELLEGRRATAVNIIKESFGHINPTQRISP